MFAWASPVAQMVKNRPAMQETPVQFLGEKEPLEKGMATHSRILAWRIPHMRNLVNYSPWGRRESDTHIKPTIASTKFRQKEIRIH